MHTHTYTHAHTDTHTHTHRHTYTHTHTHEDNFLRINRLSFYVSQNGFFWKIHGTLKYNIKLFKRFVLEIMMFTKS